MLFVTEIKENNNDFEYVLKGFITKWKDCKFESDFDIKLYSTGETFVHSDMNDIFMEECNYTDEDDIFDYIVKRKKEVSIKEALEKLLVKYNVKEVSFLIVDDSSQSIISCTSNLTISNPNIK